MHSFRRRVEHWARLSRLRVGSGLGRHRARRSGHGISRVRHGVRLRVRLETYKQCGDLRARYGVEALLGRDSDLA